MWVTFNMTVKNIGCSHCQFRGELSAMLMIIIDHSDKILGRPDEIIDHDNENIGRLDETIDHID